MLSIITIGKDNSKLVQLTIDSIAKNVIFSRDYEVELILVLRNINFADLSIPAHMNVSVIENRDRSIYHAMNIGWNASNGRHLWFLNSGDTAVFAENLIESLIRFPNSAHAFSVRLVGEVYNFRSNPHKKKLHPGFIFPNCDFRYDESGRLDADSLVISTVLESFNLRCHNYIIANFLMDGVSNQMSLQQIPSRFDRGLSATISLFLKWILYSVLPRTIFWRVWAMKNGHKRIDK
jgi:hypothetical protein